MSSFIYKYIKYPFKKLIFKLIDKVVLFTKAENNEQILLIIRLDVLGDMVMGLPFLQWLAAQPGFANKQIIFCGNVVAKPLLDCVEKPFFHSTLWINRNRFNNSIGYRWQMLRTIRLFGADTLIHPVHTWHEFDHSAIVCSAARHKIGFQHVGKHYGETMLKTMSAAYTKIIATGQGAMFEFYRNKAGFEQLAHKAPKIKDTGWPYITIKPKANIKLPFILIAPGAGSKSRTWPIENFLLCSQYITKKHGIACYFVGAGADAQFNHAINTNHGDEYNLIGKLSIGETMFLMQQALLLLGNESGPVHLMLALGGKTVCVSNGNHYGRWHPYPTEFSYTATYIYPPHFSEITHAQLVEKYYHGSSEPITQIHTDSVITALEHIIKKN